MRLSLTFLVILFITAFVLDAVWWPLISVGVATAISFGIFFAKKKLLVVPLESNHCVLITGTSTGFGKHLALHIARNGRTVFAGVRKAEDGDALRSEVGNEAASRLIPVVMDVVDDDQIARGVSTVREHLDRTNSKLRAVVNNAGYAHYAPVEVMKRADLLRQLDVNVCGIVAVSQAFLPLLREGGRGARIVNIGSLVGAMSFPFIGAYAASKHAVEAISDAMRRELLPHGVFVTCIEPGGFRTNFNATAAKSLSADDAPSGKYATATAQLRNATSNLDALLPGPGMVVADCIYALTARLPPARLLVGPDATVIGPFVSFLLPDVVMDAAFLAASYVLGWER